MRLFMFLAALINPAVLALPGGFGGPPPQGLKEPRMFETAEIENSMEPAEFYADNQQQTRSGDDTCNAASKCPAPQKYACDGTKCICWDFCSDFNCPFVKPGDVATAERCVSLCLTPNSSCPPGNEAIVNYVLRYNKYRHN